MRKYSSTIPAMTLNGSLSAGATSATITGGNNLPVIASPDALTLVIEPDTANEEIVTVTAHSAGSTSVTIVRGQEGTPDITHSSGVAVKHMVTARDLQEPHRHIVSANYSDNGSVELHGLGTSDGNVVGTSKTQTLTNKTISGTSNTISNIAQSNVTDLVSALNAKAPLASPTFTGTPAAPTATAGTNTTQLSTTAFVQSEVTSAVASKAPLANPVFTGAVYFTQPAPPTTKISTATLTALECINGIVVVSTTSGGWTLTLPTGTNIDSAVPAGLAVDSAFRWSVINTGGFTVTLAGNTNHTFSSTGNAAISSTTSASYITRKTATNTYVTYRVA